MPGNFLDTNVLVYLALGDGAKADQAEALLRLDPVISVQVLNELANVLRRKGAFSWAEVLSFLDTVRELARIVPLDVGTHELGMEVAERHGLSVYDAMIVATAVLSDCDLLWSEDMQDGLLIAGKLRIRNPFTGA